VDEWPTLITKLETTINLPLSLEQNTGLEPSEEQALAQKSILTLQGDDHDILLKRVPNSPYYLVLGPIEHPGKYSPVELILSIIFYLCLAIAVLVWIWPLWKNLRKLEIATAVFGRGEFNSRAEVSASSIIASLANSFNSMASRIQKLIQSHKDLTNAVSHDLRTPLARLRFGIEILETKKDELSKVKYLNSMRADVDELDSLISEMLTHAALDREDPKLSFSTQPVVPLLKKIVANTGMEANSKTIELDIGYEGTQKLAARFEPNYMSRALTNLLVNALRYAKQVVKIKVETIDTDCIIHIDDDGPGVPIDYRDKVFEAFERPDKSRDRNSGGFGLGLAIVNKILKWHGGTVTVTDSPIGGARFSIRWPAFEDSNTKGW
jgi:signal transduction histidine kinase